MYFLCNQHTLYFYYSLLLIITLESLWPCPGRLSNFSHELSNHKAIKCLSPTHSLKGKSRGLFCLFYPRHTQVILNKTRILLINSEAGRNTTTELNKYKFILG